MFICFFEMVVLLYSDIETNPGPSFNDSFFSSCNWNIDPIPGGGGGGGGSYLTVTFENINNPVLFYVLLTSEFTQ